MFEIFLVVVLSLILGYLVEIAKAGRDKPQGQGRLGRQEELRRLLNGKE